MNTAVQILKQYQQGSITQTDLITRLIQEAGRVGSDEVLTELPGEIVECLMHASAANASHRIISNVTFTGAGATDAWHELQEIETPRFAGA